MKNINAYMSRVPYTIESNRSVRDALEAMRCHGVRHLPVVDRDELTGIVTAWDIIVSLTNAPEAWETPISAIMTTRPRTVPAGCSMELAVRIMMDQGIGSLLVLNPNGMLAGILTEKDVLRFSLDAHGSSGGAFAEEAPFRKTTTWSMTRVARPTIS